MFKSRIDQCRSKCKFINMGHIVINAFGELIWLSKG
jgi:hypothetical protein